MQPGTKNRFKNEHKILIAILLLALVNGLIYVIIMPPWQHYDEPNHFEYIWLWAERPGRPEPHDYDTSMRQDVARSMIEHDFFPVGAELPDLSSEKPWIGQYSQLNEPPLYYLLGSIPLRILPSENVGIQLYAARLVSLILFLSTILAGYGLVTEITPPQHPLRFLVPLTMALLPGFVDLMTAVNNDVGAVAVFSFFLWGCIRLVQRGPSWQTLLWVVITCALCLITKRSVYLALPLLGIALLFAYLRGRYQKIAWGLVIVSALVGVVAVFSWGDAALWYRNTTQNYPTRSFQTGAPVGNSAFRLTAQPENPAVKLVQIIPPEIAEQLSETPVTLGAWIWASQPIDILSPQLQIFDGSQVFGEPIEVTEKPQFFALSFIPHGNTRRAWVILEPGSDVKLQHPVEIYYDGIILAEGDFPMNDIPLLTGNGSTGTWGGRPFENFLRNSSAESSWMYLRQWAEVITTQIFSDYAGQEKFSLTLYSLLDLPSTSWYYRAIAENLFRTFWAKFGWGHVPLAAAAKPYARILLPFTSAAFLGVGIGIWQHRKRLSDLPWNTFFIIGIASVVSWGMALLRGASYLLQLPAFFIVARYTYPVIVPTVLFLSAGWLTILCSLEKILRLPSWVKYSIYFGLFLILDIYALSSIIYFYGN
jgi:hypothetical protein